MERSRRNAWFVTLLSAAAFIGTLYPLTSRIRTFNRGAGLHNFHAEVLDSRRAQIGAFPEFTLTDVPGESAGAGAERAAYESFLRLDYAGKPTLIPVKRPAAFGVPTLGLYDEWVKVLAVNQVGRDAAGSTLAIPGTEQLLIISRRTPDGFDPQTWGSVRRDDWVFDFYELKPAGEVVTARHRWPRSDRAEKRLEGGAANPLKGIEPLRPRTLEYFAAMHAIPKLNMPKYRFDDTALRFETLGWPLPVSMLSMLGVAGGLVFAVAPRRAARGSVPA